MAAGKIEGLRERLVARLENGMSNNLRADFEAMILYIDGTREKQPEHLVGRMMAAAAGGPASDRSATADQTAAARSTMPDQEQVYDL